MSKVTASLTINILFGASPAEVDEAIDCIRNQFGAPAVATITPTQAAAIVEPETVNADAPSHDKSGLPWDERIHSGTKAINEDGTWRNKRGVDKGLLSKVQTELRATVSAPAPVAGPIPVQVEVPMIPMPPLPGANIDSTYSNFLTFIAGVTKSDTNPAGRVPAEWVQAVLAQFGVAEGSLQNLAHRIDLIPAIEAAIKQALAA